MKAEIRKIGNSRGIIVPKTVLEQCQLQDSVEMEVSEFGLIIRPSLRKRESWKESFSKVRREDEDKGLSAWQSFTNESDKDLEW